MTAAHPESVVESISYRQLKLFESVGRLNSVRRGSEECNLSQPAVTQALAKLEQELGFRLLERRASGSYLTAEGAILHRRVTRLFTLLVEALTELEVPGGLAGAQASANRISRSQIRALLAIAECGSFGQAAQKLGLTQASLQRAARDLESNLKKPIYYRTAAGVMVTPLGVEFARKVVLALQELDWGIEEVETARGAGKTRLAIGALPFGGSVLLASVLEKFVSDHPEADLRIVNEGATEMMNKLRAGDVDLVIGIIQPDTQADLATTLLAETPYEIVARRGHPLLGRGKIGLEDLSRYDWVVGTEGSSRRRCFDALFAGTPSPKTSIATCSLPIIRHLLAGSDRLTVMTSYERIHEGATLMAIPAMAIRPVPMIGITMRANWLPTRLHQSFMDLLQARVLATATLPDLRRVG